MKQDVNEIRAVVSGVDGDFAWVEAEQGGCGRCHEEGGCGGQQLTQMFCAGPKRYRARNTAAARIGDKVIVALPQGAVRRLANLAYVLPLFGLIGGAAFGAMLFSDRGAMLGGALGLFVAWMAMRFLLRFRTGNPDFQPYIVSLQ